MQKVLITGMSGFIGGYLKNRFEGKYLLYGLGCDLLNIEDIRNRLIDVQPDYIVHLAARTEVEKSFYEQTSFSEVNYVGTVNLIESIRQIELKLKLFVFSSTMETYGWQPESDLIRDNKEFVLPVFNETTVQNPNAPYAVAKVGCEYYLDYAKRAYNLPYCILRQTNTYGRIDNDYFVIEQIITQMLDNPNEINLGYGKPYRNFLWIDDLIDLYDTILEKPDQATNHVFCTGPNNALSIEQLVKNIANKLSWNGKVNWNKKLKRHGEIYVLNSTNDKVTSILGWSPKVDLDEGLDRTIKIWKEKRQA